jgi:hypothetical protein
MVVMMGLLAFAVDLGYLYVARDQLQRSADAAALAGAWELIDENAPAGNSCPWETEVAARNVAGQYAGLNRVFQRCPGLSQDDVQVGYLADPWDPASTVAPAYLNPANAVQVRVRRTADQNGEVPLFFARALGLERAAVQAEATAVLLKNVVGFRAPADGGNVGMLPFALDQETWNGLLDGVGTDDWTWDEEEGAVVPGGDGVLEVNLFPQGTGSPGNRGTVDIGSNNNSTADIARQILDGVSPDDLEYHDGKLELDDNGELFLNGDTGISAGVKDELESIKGRPSTLPIFAEVLGNGNNAEYTIVQFAGVRIVEVKLTGKMSGKRVMIQPANMVAKGVIPSTSDDQTSYYVYSTAWLVR